MFVIGETKGKVINGKVALPKEYHLRKKMIVGIWGDDCTLYLSDNDKSLYYMAGKENACFLVNLDGDDRIIIPDKYENYNVDIKGCISTVEIRFHK